MLTLEFYVPHALEETLVKEIKRLSNKWKSSLNTNVTKFVIDKSGETGIKN